MTDDALRFLRESFERIERRFDQLEAELAENYMRRDVFEARTGNLERLVYGAVTLILLGVGGAVVRLVIAK